MSIRIKLAETPEEIRDVLALRHTVFVEQDGYIPDQGGYIVDLYDALPATRNVIALEAGRVVGGLRLTPEGPAGMASDKSLDFRPHLPAGARAVSASMLCIDKDARGRFELLGGMMKLGAYYATSVGGTHVCAPLNPKVERVMLRVGFEAVGEVFTDPTGLPTLPLVLDLAAMQDAFLEYIARQDVGLWLENFEREVFAEGEEVLARGESGSRAYFLVDGEVEVRCPEDRPLARLGAGEVFGELALLTDAPRSARVVAASRCEAMVLDREAFRRQVRRSPELAFSLLETLGGRLQGVLQRVAEAGR